MEIPELARIFSLDSYVQLLILSGKHLKAMKTDIPSRFIHGVQ
jgi:hypothetical protein